MYRVIKGIEVKGLKLQKQRVCNCKKIKGLRSQKLQKEIEPEKRMKRKRDTR
jgi:hypothetical protein